MITMTEKEFGDHVADECAKTAERVDRAVREECAGICEAYSKHNKMHPHHAEAAADCADEIRESIKGTAKNGLNHSASADGAIVTSVRHGLPGMLGIALARRNARPSSPLSRKDHLTLSQNFLRSC